MTESPDKPAPTRDEPRRARRLKPPSLLRLSLGRPLLPITLSRSFGWLAFFLLAILPLGLTTAVVLYLTSPRWPADLAAQLSRDTGLQITVGRVTWLTRNRMELLGVSISPRPGAPAILTAMGGTYDTGEFPSLSLREVKLELNLDWWTNSKAAPDPILFFDGPSGGKPPTLDLHGVTVKLVCAGHWHVFHADAGMASLSNGLLVLKLAGATTPSLAQTGTDESRAKTGPLAARELLTASLGYQHGVFVKRLSIKHAPADLIREHLARILSKEWASAFLDLQGDLTLHQPLDGVNWELDGQALFEPALLEEPLGFSGLTGKLSVSYDRIMAYDDSLFQGTFQIRLAENPTAVASCSPEALRALQMITTGTQFLPAEVEPRPFDQAGAVVTVNRLRIYVQPTGQDNAALANRSQPILRFRPQEITRQEWTRRMQFLRTLWTSRRIS